MKGMIRTALSFVVALIVIPLFCGTAAADWQWHSPLPQGNRLTDMWAASDSDLFAVGDRGTIVHYDGIELSVMETGTTENLLSVWGFSGSDVYAVGVNGTVLHFDGSQWTPLDIGITYTLTGVWGSSSSDLYVVGYYYTSYWHGVMYHYDGSQWTQINGDFYGFNDIWGITSSNIFAVATDGRIYHYDGATWSLMSGGGTRDIFSVFGSSGDNVVAGTWLGAVLQYDGSQWSASSIGTTPLVYGVWCDSPTNIFAVGSYSTIARYDGSAWTALTSDMEHTFWGVWGTGPNSVYFCGDGGKIYHYNGSGLNELTSGTSKNIESVWGSSNNSIFAVGPDGYCSFYDGSTWTQMDTGIAWDLKAVWGRAASDVYTAGYYGRMYHYDGATWSLVYSDSSSDDIRDIWGDDSGNIYATGAYGLFLKNDGSGWTNTNFGTNGGALHAGWSSGSDNIYLVGDNGVVFHYNGSGWESIGGMTTDTLYAVWGVAPDIIYAGGGNAGNRTGVLFQYDGATWTQISDNCISTTIKDIWGDADDNLFAVDINGDILHFDGTQWTMHLENFNRNGLLAIWGDGTGHIYAGGGAGTILHYNPLPEISLSLPLNATESDGVLQGQAVISLAAPAVGDVIISLSSGDTSEVSVPGTVDIPDGQSSVTFDFSVIDDVLIDGSQFVELTVQADGYKSNSVSIRIDDNETNGLQVAVPSSAIEGDGVLVGQGTVTSMNIVDEDVVVNLATGNSEEVLVPKIITIAAGQSVAVFDLTVVDDGLIDGAETVTVSAFVAGWDQGSDTITIEDNESLQLSVTIAASASEGDGVLADAGSVSISAPFLSDLSVDLISSDSSIVTVPSSVTISAGMTSAPFDLTIVDDNTPEGSQAASISAGTGGFLTGSADIVVEDNDPHHFVISTIGNQQAGEAFFIVIEAQDPTGNVVQGFSGTAALSAAGTGGAVNLTPAVTSAFVNGQWTGSITIDSMDSSIVLTADNGNATGVSNTFDILSGPLEQFQISAISDPQFIGVPFAVTITAQDALGHTVTNFTDTVSLTGLNGANGEIIIGTGTSTWTYPLYTYYHDARTQVIYTAAEIGGAATINAIALDVTGTPGQTMNNWTIRMKHTTLDYYTSYAWESSWTVVYQNNETISTTGWHVFTFPTPFQYNGSDNLMIDFSFNNSSYTSNGTCRYTGQSQMRTLYYNTDSGYGDPLSWTGTGSPTPKASSNVPNVKIIADGAIDISPTVSGAFTNGVWTGNISILETASAIQIEASDGQGHVGTSNSFDVILQDTDTDADGISDGDEVTVYGTNPAAADSDSDGIDDGDELSYWGEAWREDIDNDGLINILDDDADDDGANDGAEVAYGSDPADPGSIPSLCANGSATIVSSYPYFEGFESGLGDWINVTDDMINWTRFSGSTSSSATGPTGALEGTYYTYIEASSPNYPGKTAILEGPWFDLANTSQAELSFWYHMYGAAMGTLSVDVSEDGCNSWQTVWSLSGDQGNSWKEAIVDLSAYLGRQITVRFHGVTGTNYTSDISIDSISVEVTAALPCDVDADCDDNQFCTGQETCVDQICQPGIDPCPGQSCNEDLQICEDAECLNDTDCDDNNACTIDLCDNGECTSEYENLIASFPYGESFETGLGAWRNNTGDMMDWTRMSGSTSSSSTGPTGAYQGTYYIYIESSSPNYPSKTAIIDGPRFDLSSAVLPQLTFRYHMYGTAMGTLRLEVSGDCQNWVSVWSKTGNQGSAWIYAAVDLSSYAGQVIAVRFYGITASSYTSDMSVDDIALTID